MGLGINFIFITTQKFERRLNIVCVTAQNPQSYFDKKNMMPQKLQCRFNNIKMPSQKM